MLGGAAVGAAGVGAAALVGCNSSGGGNGNGNGSSSGVPAVGSPVPGGTITSGRSVASLGIDPHIDLTGLDIDSVMYSYMYSWDPVAEEAILNNLAAEFENPDPLTFLFTIRDDVKAWPAPYGREAAGEIITSADCEASFMRRGTALTAPDKRFPQRIDRYETPDDTHFNFYLSRPFIPAVREMANATWAIVPKKVIDANPSLSQIAAGSGPFMMEEFRGQERIVLIRHPEHFCAPKPWLDTWRHIVITEDSSLLAAFRNGDHDINGAFLDRERAEDFDADENFVVHKAPSLFYPVVHFKMRPPWDNVKVREAFSLAVNRDELIDTIQDGEGNYNGPIQWPQFNWALPQEELRQFYKFDQDRARELLAEAGVPNPTATMKIPDLPAPSIIGRTAELIQNQVNQVGFNIELDPIELGAFISSTILPGNFDLAFFPNLPYDEPDRPLAFYHSQGVTGTGNWTNYTNPELDELIDAQAEEFDPEKRKEIILEAQRMILPEFGPQLTFTGGFNYSAHWNHVGFGPQGAQSFGGLATDELPDVDFCPFGSEIWTTKS